MRSDVIQNMSYDLLSVPPLIFRFFRRKFIKNSLAEGEEKIEFPHLEIMTLLSDEGTMNIAKICDRLQIAKAQMTYLLDRIENLKLAERQLDATDRRALNIALTDKGRSFIKNHMTLMSDAFSEEMSSLTDDELEALSASLKTLRKILFKVQNITADL
jgi:DNA-binding MarR family transcriptional regulator